MGWREEAQGRVKEMTAGKSISLPEGVTVLRIMPHKKDIQPDGTVARDKNGRAIIKYSPKVEYNRHCNVGPNNLMCSCGKNVQGVGKDWLCDEVITKLQASDVKAKKDLAYNLRRQPVLLVMASVYNEDTKTFMPARPWYIANQKLQPLVLSKIAQSRKDIIDPKNGYNLRVERVGQKLKTQYPSVQLDDEPTVVPVNILKGVRALEELLRPYSESEQKATYHGKPQEVQEQEDEQAAGDEGYVEDYSQPDPLEEGADPNYEPDPDAEDAPLDEVVEGADQGDDFPPEDTPEDDVPQEYSPDDEPPFEEDAEPEPEPVVSRPRRPPAPPAPRQRPPAPAPRKPAPAPARPSKPGPTTRKAAPQRRPLDRRS